jgi:hypothetical protein
MHVIVPNPSDASQMPCFRVVGDTIGTRNVTSSERVFADESSDRRFERLEAPVCQPSSV